MPASQDFPGLESSDYTIHAAFEQIAGKFPDQNACATPNGGITFSQLNSWANSIANQLRDPVRGAGSLPVAILLPKGPAWFAALLGALKAGLPVSPLEPQRAVDQVQYQVRDLGAGTVLTNAAGIGLAQQLGALHVLVVDETPPAEFIPNPDYGVRARDLAAIFYTSGSSGQPRGVATPHRSILKSVRIQIEELGFGPQDRVMMLTFHSGAVFCALLSGADTSCLSENDGGLASIPDRIRNQRTTVIMATTSTFRTLTAMAASPEVFASVRMVYTGSEMCLQSDLELFREFFPANASFVQRYGSTEALGVAVWRPQPGETIPRDLIPLGRPYPDKELLVLGDDGQPVPPGSVGELAVRSRFLNSGYWKRPEETAARFLVDDPHDPELRTFLTNDLAEVLPDGSVVLHGRRDTQVKIRGTLVSLHRVEAALSSVEDIEEAVVVASEDREANQRLVAYVRLAPGVPWLPERVHRDLSQRIPESMAPAVIIPVLEWPRLPSGKIDKAALPKPPRTRGLYFSSPATQPRTAAQQAIAAIWREVLELDEVGIDDNFFSLGGDSLGAAVAAARLSHHFFTGISAEAIFDFGTVAALAAHLDRTPLDPALDLALSEVESLPMEEVRRLLSLQLPKA